MLKSPGFLFRGEFHHSEIMDVPCLGMPDLAEQSLLYHIQESKIAVTFKTNCGPLTCLFMSFDDFPCLIESNDDGHFGYCILAVSHRAQAYRCMELPWCTA